MLEKWFQNLKIQITRWTVPQNIQRSLPKIAHIQLELDHTTVWYMQGEKATAKPLDYYPIVEEIFHDLARQSGTKLSILAKAKEINQPIKESLTDQEKEKDYELRLHISTFMSDDIPTKVTNTLQITIIPPLTQRGNTPTEQ